MKFIICWVISFCLIGESGIAQNFLPAPLSVRKNGRWKYEFSWKEKITVLDTCLGNEAEVLKRVLKKRTGREAEINVSSRKVNSGLVLRLDPSVQHPEGYRLSVSPGEIVITGKTPAGVFYGVQTLDQLLLGDGGSCVCKNVEAIAVVDTPRYGYRALMLDPARHFIPIPEVKRYIDLMARYKFNVLQLHLTDDQGWRMEIKKYPQLTEAGAFRKEGGSDKGPDNGFYTQEELADLIRYAARRHVEIVPELDIPGHTVALLASLPELGCVQWDSILVVVGKTTDRTVCAANERVYEVYGDILREVCTVFPSKRIHLGGDEAVIEKNWGECRRCRALMEEKGYRDVREVMGYFFERMYQLIKAEGKELMLWCELDNIRMPAEEFLFEYPKDCTLFTWRMGLTPKVLELTAKAGISLVASPGEHCYFDYPQWKGDLPEFNNWGMPLLSLQQAYDFDPGYGLPETEQRHVIGVAGLLWGEALQDINRITYMTYPRALALAEAGWSVMGNRDWHSFQRRMYPQLFDLMRNGVSFRVPFEIVPRETGCPVKK